jgi:DNA-directed RNA polymerase subunit RPC12/RpoP
MDVQQTRFFVKPVWCPHCTEKLLVHVRVQTEPAQRGGPQTVECLKCHKGFDVMAPNEIIAGPFHSGS